jgi:hypothetical protein
LKSSFCSGGKKWKMWRLLPPQVPRKCFLFYHFNSHGAFAFYSTIIDHVSHKAKAENIEEEKTIMQILNLRSLY